MLKEHCHKGFLLLFTCAAFIFGTVITANAQLRIAPSENIGGRIACHVGDSNYWLTPIPKRIGIVAANTEEMQAVLDKINRYTGLTINIDLIAVKDSPNVEICPSDPGMNGSLRNFIAYNPEWVQGVYNDTQNEWVIYAIVAHEAGHYFLNHDRTSVGSDPSIESKADEYAGEILARMGASLQDAQAAFNSARFHPRGPTHPAVAQRKESVRKGWEKVKPINSTVAPEYTYQITGWIESGRPGNREIINRVTHHMDRFPFVEGNFLNFDLTITQFTNGGRCNSGRVMYTKRGTTFPEGSTSSRRGEARPIFAGGVQVEDSHFLVLYLNPGLNCTIR